MTSCVRDADSKCSRRMLQQSILAARPVRHGPAARDRCASFALLSMNDRFRRRRMCAGRRCAGGVRGRRSWLIEGIFGM